MSFPNPPIPSTSLPALWSLVAGDDETEEPPPIDTSGFNTSSQNQLPAGDKNLSNKSADEFIVPQEQSSVNGNLAWDDNDTFHRTCSFSHFQRKNNSLCGVLDPHEDDKSVAPQHSDVRLIKTSSIQFEGLLANRSSDETIHHVGSFSDLAPMRSSFYGTFDHKLFVRPPPLTAIREMSKSSEDIQGLLENSVDSSINTEEPDIAEQEQTSNRDLKVIDHSGIDFMNTPVSVVMTKSPLFVSSDTLVMKALEKMLDGKVTRLPVIENGEVIGVGHLHTCLFHVMGNMGMTAEHDNVIAAAFERVAQSNNDFDAQEDRLPVEMPLNRGLTMKQSGLQKVLTAPETTTLHEARCRMAAGRAKVLVLMDSTALPSGILTNKDIVSRVIASGTGFENTPISNVMIANPISVSFNNPIVEGLQKILEEEATQFPVIEKSEVISLVAVEKFNNVGLC